MISRFVANSEKCRIYTFLDGSAQIFTILHRGVIKIWEGGVFPIYYNITMGGGVSRDPNFLLRNIWTAPKTYAREICHGDTTHIQLLNPARYILSSLYIR